MRRRGREIVADSYFNPDEWEPVVSTPGAQLSSPFAPSTVRQAIAVPTAVFAAAAAAQPQPMTGANAPANIFAWAQSLTAAASRTTDTSTDSASSAAEDAAADPMSAMPGQWGEVTAVSLAVTALEQIVVYRAGDTVDDDADATDADVNNTDVGDDSSARINNCNSSANKN